MKKTIESDVFTDLACERARFTAVHVGSRIRMRRRLNGVTAAELCDATKIPLDALRMYEAGESRIHVGDLFEICRYFDLPIVWFFDGLDQVADILIGKNGLNDAKSARAFVEDDSRELLKIYAEQVHDSHHLRYMVELARLFAEMETERARG